MPARRMKLASAPAVPAAPATPMTRARLLTSPSLTPKMTARSVPDRPDRCQRSRAAMSCSTVSVVAPALQLPPDLGVLPLVGGDRGDLGRRLRLVQLLLVALERGDEVGHGPRPEDPGEQHDDRDAKPRPGRRRRNVGAALLELAGPDVGVAPLVRRDPRNAAARRGSFSIAGEGVVEEDRVALERRFSRLWAVSGDIGAILPGARLAADGGRRTHRRCAT